MSQDIFADINPSTTSGIQLATYLNEFKAALMSNMSGTSRPSELLEGGMWLDTTDEGTPNFKWYLKIYDGSTDRTLLTLNLTTGGIILAGSEDTFNIQHISADAVGPILKFTKQRIASSGQVLSGDVIGEADWISRGDDSSNPLVAKLKVIAGQNHSATTSASYFELEATPVSSTTRGVWMRFKNALLGIGGAFDPESTIHSRGTTGIRDERLADDANPAQLIWRKKRIAGTGAVQNNDIIGILKANSTDDATAEATTASLETVATQAHTASAQGTKWIFRAIANASASLTAIMEVGEEIKSLVLHSMERIKLNAQNVSTTATIAQLSADKALVRMTGSTATTIQGINSAAGKTKVITIHNDSTAIVTCAHQNGSAAAADRFTLPSGLSFTIPAQASATFFYDETDTNWKVKSVAGNDTGIRKVADATARAALSPTEGDFAVQLDTDVMYYYNGSAWVGNSVGQQLFTNWVSYTPSISTAGTQPTEGTGVSKSAFWRRVGDSIEIKWTYKQTGAGSDGTGDYWFNTPSGLTIDTSKITSGNDTYGMVLGPARVYNAGTEKTFCYLRNESGTPKIVIIRPSTTGTVQGGGDGLSNAFIGYSFTATLPITEYAFNP